VQRCTILKINRIYSFKALIISLYLLFRQPEFFVIISIKFMSIPYSYSTSPLASWCLYVQSDGRYITLQGLDSSGVGDRDVKYTVMVSRGVCGSAVNYIISHRPLYSQKLT